MFAQPTAQCSCESGVVKMHKTTLINKHEFQFSYSIPFICYDNDVLNDSRQITMKPRFFAQTLKVVVENTVRLI